MVEAQSAAPLLFPRASHSNHVGYAAVGGHWPLLREGSAFLSAARLRQILPLPWPVSRLSYRAQDNLTEMIGR